MSEFSTELCMYACGIGELFVLSRKWYPFLFVRAGTQKDPGGSWRQDKKKSKIKDERTKWDINTRLERSEAWRIFSNIGLPTIIRCQRLSSDLILGHEKFTFKRLKKIELAKKINALTLKQTCSRCLHFRLRPRTTAAAILSPAFASHIPADAPGKQQILFKWKCSSQEKHSQYLALYGWSRDL